LNKNDFISLIEQPEILGKSHITALKSIAADFPYFQTAQLLLTKALYNEKHYEFEKQLKYASVMVPDRSVLFKYLHNLQGESAARVQQSAALVDEIIEDKITLGNPPLAVSAEGVIVEEISEKPQHSEVIISEQEELPVAEISEPLVEVESIVDHQEITNPIEEISAVIEEEEEFSTSNVELPTSNNEHQTSSVEVHSFSEWLLLQQNAPIEIAEEKNTEIDQNITEKEELIVEVPTSSIQPQTSNLKPQTPNPEPPTINPVEEATYLKIIEASEKQQLQQIKVGIQEEITKSVERSNVNEFESILDKFIRENPRISRGKAEFYNPQNMAKQSVAEDDELVTETLANMYYKQGHYKKAIRAYEKLCLIYPHKLTYFANLIQKIKTENKD
jgi:tetratricopeptide (TPR) repeat protein